MKEYIREVGFEKDLYTGSESHMMARWASRDNTRLYIFDSVKKDLPPPTRAETASPKKQVGDIINTAEEAASLPDGSKIGWEGFGSWTRRAAASGMQNRPWVSVSESYPCYRTHRDMVGGRITSIPRPTALSHINAAQQAFSLYAKQAHQIPSTWPDMQENFNRTIQELIEAIRAIERKQP